MKALFHTSKGIQRKELMCIICHPKAQDVMTNSKNRGSGRIFQTLSNL